MLKNNIKSSNLNLLIKLFNITNYYQDHHNIMMSKYKKLLIKNNIFKNYKIKYNNYNLLLIN